jgi:hypothetical protein
MAHTGGTKNRWASASVKGSASYPASGSTFPKKGGSRSVVGRGATMNISKKGVRETVGLPGSGISYQTKRVGIGQQQPTAKRPRQSVTPARFLAFIAVVVIVLWVLAHWH